MSGDGSVELFFGDGPHRFRFAIGQFRELQEKVNARRVAIGAPVIGPGSLLQQLRENNVWPDDLRDILRLGLTGGGMSGPDAHRLLVNYFDEAPPQEHVTTAFVALFAGLVGVPDDEIASKKRPTGRASRNHPILHRLRHRRRHRVVAAPGRRMFVLATARGGRWVEQRP